MVPSLRKKYNSEFTDQKYEAFLNDLNSSLKYPTDFRVSETPLFLSKELTAELEKACSEILEQIKSETFLQNSKKAIPDEFFVPNETEHPEFLQFDFAISKDQNGKYIPKLIELQGFPSLYGYQVYLFRKIKEHFNLPDNLTCYFSGLTEQDYITKFKKTILKNCDAENVILLEIEPEKQKTRIDFAATEKLTGIKTVPVSDIIAEGKNLFYKKDNKKIKIDRIYNRIIFDEIVKKNIKLPFDFAKDYNLTWAGHPNWFFKISKFSLPSLKGKYIPRCYFLDKLKKLPDDLNNFVLKPLFSFAGQGVDVEITKNKLDQIKNKSNYILQEKVQYAPLIETPEGFSMAEIRMMYLWKDEPILSNNLVRMSKGKMMGVDFNKNKTWVGSSLALHE